VFAPQARFEDCLERLAMATKLKENAQVGNLGAARRKQLQ
jgi:hypothetical protein